MPISIVPSEAAHTSETTHAAAFANAPYMNNHGTFDYEVIVESYDKDALEAVVTVRRIGSAAIQALTVTVMQGTYVRQKPDASSPTVGYIEQEAQLEYSDFINGWYNVILSDGTEGYVYTSRIVN